LFKTTIHKLAAQFQDEQMLFLLSVSDADTVNESELDGAVELLLDMDILHPYVTEGVLKKKNLKTEDIVSIINKKPMERLYELIYRHNNFSHNFNLYKNDKFKEYVLRRKKEVDLSIL
jgi:hypothetical protein